MEPTPCLFLRGKMADLVPCLSIVSILIVVFSFIAFMRYMNYRETLVLAEKGLTRPETKSNKGFLRWGILVTALGIALSLGLYFVGFDCGQLPASSRTVDAGRLRPAFSWLRLNPFSFSHSKGVRFSLQS